MGSRKSAGGDGAGSRRAFYFREVTSQVAMPAWIFGDCREAVSTGIINTWQALYIKISV